MLSFTSLLPASTKNVEDVLPNMPFASDIEQTDLQGAIDFARFLQPTAPFSAPTHLPKLHMLSAKLLPEGAELPPKRIPFEMGSKAQPTQAMPQIASYADLEEVEVPIAATKAPPPDVTSASGATQKRPESSANPPPPVLRDPSSTAFDLVVKPTLEGSDERQFNQATKLPQSKFPDAQQVELASATPTGTVPALPGNLVQAEPSTDAEEQVKLRGARLIDAPSAGAIPAPLFAHVQRNLAEGTPPLPASNDRIEEHSAVGEVAKHAVTHPKQDPNPIPHFVSSTRSVRPPSADPAQGSMKTTLVAKSTVSASKSAASLPEFQKPPGKSVQATKPDLADLSTIGHRESLKLAKHAPVASASENAVKPSVPPIALNNPKVAEVSEARTLSADDPEPGFNLGRPSLDISLPVQAPQPLATQIGSMAQANALQLTQSQTQNAIQAQVIEAMRTSSSNDIEIRLEPEELGRLRIIMSPREGGMHVLVLAERPETLDLMRRHSDEFGGYLSDGGHEDAEIEFQAYEDPDELDDETSDAVHIEATHASTAKPPQAVIDGHLDIRL